MLTIQPNFTQRLHSQPVFKNKYDYAEDIDFTETEEIGGTDEFTNSNPRNLPVLASQVSVDEDLSLLKDDINDAMSGLQKVSDKMPKPVKSGIDALCLLGGGAVVGISTSFGWKEGGKVLKKVAQNPAVKKFGKNLSKLSENISAKFNKFKDTGFYKGIANKFSEWGQKFAKTKFGGKVCDFFNAINDSKPVKAVKSLFAKAKTVKAGQVADTTGDVVAVSTGVSTVAAGALSDDKKKTKNDVSNEDDFNVTD